MPFRFSPGLGALFAATALAAPAAALPVAWTGQLSSGYGSSYGGNSIIQPVTWEFGFTIDPDTITPTNFASGNGNTTTTYNQSAGITGYLRNGGQTANILYMEAGFSTQSYGRYQHSFFIRYVIDEHPYADPQCARQHGAQYCWDTDQNDGLAFTTSQGSPSNIDVNRIQFSFGGNNTTGQLFAGTGSLADDMSWIFDERALIGSNMDVYGYGIGGSQYGVLSATDPTVSAAPATSTVPLPAAAWSLLAALGALTTLRIGRRPTGA